MKQVTACLCMIVKDEADVIERCLRSVALIITHYYIEDTGSTDDTIAIIERVMAELGVRGQVVKRPWKDFATNRNLLLASAPDHVEWLVTVDADEELEFPTENYQLWKSTGEDYWNITTRLGEIEYPRPQLLKANQSWEYKGVVHETLVLTDKVCGGTSAIVNTPRHDGARSKNPDKFLHDAELLAADLDKDPTNTRNQFYLAQSYKDAGRADKATTHYLRRVGMGGWPEEIFISYMRLADLTLQLNPGSTLTHNTPSQRTNYLLQAYNVCPHRGSEPLVKLAEHHRGNCQYHLALLYAKAAANHRGARGTLFVLHDVYAWKLDDELSMALYYTGNFEQATVAARRALNGAPPKHIERLRANLAFCIAKEGRSL